MRCTPLRLKVVLISLLTLLSLLTVGFLVWQSMREYTAALDAANRQLLGNARSLAEHAAQSLGETDRLLQRVVEGVRQMGGASRVRELQLHRFLRQQTEGMRQIGTVMVVDAAGRSVATGLNFPQKPLSIADREYFRFHRDNPDGGLLVGRPVMSKVIDKMIFTLTRPIVRADGSFDGLVVVSFPIDYFDRFYQSVATRPDLQTVLLRTDGWLLVASPHDERAYQVNIRHKELLSRRINQTEYGVFRNRQAIFDDLDRQIGYARLSAPFQELVAVVTVTRASVLAGWGQSLVQNSVAALLLLAVTISLGVLLLLRLRDLERTEAALREREERFRSIFERANTGIAFADLQGNLLQFNRHFCELLGYAPEQLHNLHFSVFTHPDDCDAELELYREIMAGQRNEYRLEKRYLTQSGQTVWVDLSVATIRNEAGQPVNFVGLVVDITERKRIEQELSLAKQAAEEASLAKSRFLAVMSHEIRTPMNAIQGMAHLLKQTDLDERQADYLQVVLDASGILMAIINDILDISKIEAGKMQLEQEVINLQQMLGSIVALLRLRAEQKGLTLQLEADPQLPELVLGDPVRLGQILNNLVSNAVKFTEQGKVVLRVVLQEQGEQYALIRFEVEDSGIGIAQEHQASLFQPFTQADSSIARRFGGTGLGLSISSELAHLMGGELRFASSPGSGSTFSFSIRLILPYGLPELSVQLPQPQERSPANIDSSGCTVENPQQLALLVNELTGLLEKQHMGALRLFEQLAEQLEGCGSVELAEIREKIRQLAFSEAADALHRLAQRLGIP